MTQLKKEHMDLYVSEYNREYNQGYNQPDIKIMMDIELEENKKKACDLLMKKIFDNVAKITIERYYENKSKAYENHTIVLCLLEDIKCSDSIIVGDNYWNVGFLINNEEVYYKVYNALKRHNWEFNIYNIDGEMHMGIIIK